MILTGHNQLSNQEAQDRYYRDYGEEPAICKHFGCGATLSATERLCGNLCHAHIAEEIINKSLVTYLSSVPARGAITIGSTLLAFRS